jgi:hypothetical protein
MADKLSRFCFPCIFVVAKLMPLLQTIQQTAEFGQFAADQTKKLSASGIVPLVSISMPQAAYHPHFYLQRAPS